MLLICLNLFVSTILDALNTRKSATTKQTPYTAIFGQNPNNLRNIDFNGSSNPLEESVENILPQLQNLNKEASEAHSSSTQEEQACVEVMESNANLATENTEKLERPKPTPRRYVNKPRPVPLPRPQPHIEEKLLLHQKKITSKKDYSMQNLLDNKTVGKNVTPLPNLQANENSDPMDSCDSSESEDPEQIKKVQLDLEKLRGFCSNSDE